MDNNQIAQMLKANTNMTDKEIQKHIERGVFLWDNYEEYIEDCLNSMMDYEEAVDLWDELEIMEFNGRGFKVDFAL